MESRQRQGLLDFSVLFRVCLWEAFHLYNKSSPGRAVARYEKGAKNGAMSDSHGKNRSCVKINLSVLQHLLHKPEQKQKKKKPLVRRGFLPLKPPFMTLSWVLCGAAEAEAWQQARGDGGFHSWAAATWLDRTPARVDTVHIKPRPFPGTGTDVLHCLSKSRTLHAQGPFPKMRPRKPWMVVKIPPALLPRRLNPPQQQTC